MNGIRIWNLTEKSHHSSHPQPPVDQQSVKNGEQNIILVMQVENATENLQNVPKIIHPFSNDYVCVGSYDGTLSLRNTKV